MLLELGMPPCLRLHLVRGGGPSPPVRISYRRGGPL